MLTQIFQDFINKYGSPKIIFDIGSRDLMQSVELRNAYPSAKIFAFEPNPEQREICLARAKEFNIEFFDYAMSDTDGETTFYAVDKNCPDPNVGASSLFDFSDEVYQIWKNRNQSPQVTTKPYQVKTITLDSFCQSQDIEQVDGLWMDTQGSELAILKASKIILPNCKVIQAEAEFRPLYKGQPLYLDLKNYLESQGFSEDYCRVPYQPEYASYAHSILDTDSIFVNKKFK